MAGYVFIARCGSGVGPWGGLVGHRRRRVCLEHQQFQKLEMRIAIA
jgi:hypothetical protein